MFFSIFGVIYSKETKITLMAVGDVNPQVLSGYCYHELQGLQKKFLEANVVLGNLESPLTNNGQLTLGKSLKSIKEGSDFVFKSDVSMAKKLTYLGFDVFNLANNHMMDYCAKGLSDTITTLKQNNLYYFAAGDNIPQARQPLLVKYQGTKFAFLGYSEIVPVYSAAGKKNSGIAYLDYPSGARNRQILEEDIKVARQQGAEIIVVSLHWGTELAFCPDPYQKEFAHYLIDQGVDLVIGHHPHVLQPIEIYKGKIIAYSLGNFIFRAASSGTQKTEILKITFSQNNGRWFQNHQIIPMIIQNGLPRIIKE